VLGGVVVVLAVRLGVFLALFGLPREFAPVDER